MYTGYPTVSTFSLVKIAQKITTVKLWTEMLSKVFFTDNKFLL